jgi:hypothetical protein
MTATPLYRTSPPPLNARLRTRLRRGCLDRRLAAGELPRSPDLALRARRLCEPRFRAGLASGLERVLECAAEPPVTLSARAPLARGAVLGAQPELRSLAERLRTVEHPEPQGVALAEWLLTDGTGPLYTAGSAAQLANVARHASDALLARHRY